MKIALVDDEAVILQGMAKLIAEMDSHYHIAGSYRNGKDAIVQMDLEQLDLVITDIKMPFMDGLELIKEIHFRKPGMACLILSGFADFEYARAAMRYCAVDYMIKPVDPDELEQKLAELAKAQNHQKIPVDDHANKADKRIIQDIKEWIGENFCGEFDLSALSERLHLNPNYLSRLFKLETGMSMTEYLIGMRIDKAKEMLLGNPGMKVYEVAEKVGYADSVYFNKLFKKMVELTPKEFREKK